MKIDPLPQDAAVVTLQTVLDRLSSHPGLSASRRRDLRSAVTSFAACPKLVNPAARGRRAGRCRRPREARCDRAGLGRVRANGGPTFGATSSAPSMLGVTADAQDRRNRARRRLEAPFGRSPAAGFGRRIARFARWASLRRIAPAGGPHRHRRASSWNWATPRT